MKKLYIFILVATAISSCASNPYKEFYFDQAGGVDLKNDIRVAKVSTSPELIYGTNVEKDSLAMAEKGYMRVGYSSFNAANIDQRLALEQAKAIGAHVVVIYSQYTKTESGVMPITTPTTQTSHTSVNATAFGNNGRWATANANGTTTTYGTQTQYVPYSVDRYDHFAEYWVKSKPPVFGVYVKDLSADKRRDLASNKGVEITAVIMGSPAFKADILIGDVIRKIGPHEIYSQKEFNEVMPQMQGKKASIVLIRNGKTITKEIRFNTLEG